MAAGAATVATVVDCLRSRAHGDAFITLASIRTATGVDLARNPPLLQALRNNASIEVSVDGGGLRFLPPYKDLRDVDDVLALLNLHGGAPILEADVLASNRGLAGAVRGLVDEGRVIRLRNIDALGSPALFPRVDPLWCVLPGRVTCEAGCSSVRTSASWTREVVRGDLVAFRGTAAVSHAAGEASSALPAGPVEVEVEVRFRVSTATTSTGADTPCLQAQLTGAQDSAAPWRPHVIRDANRYLVPTTSGAVPSARPLAARAADARASRLGLSADLREMWRHIRSPPPGDAVAAALLPHGYPKTHDDLRQSMLRRGIQPGPAVAGTVGRADIAESRKRSLAKVAAAAASKRVRRVVVRARGSESNAHIAGTVVGAAVERSRVRLAQKQAEAKRAAALEDHRRRTGQP